MVITRTTRNRFVGVEPARGFESHALRHKGTVAMIQIATVLFNYSYRKTIDIKPKARSVGSNENLPTSLFPFFVAPGYGDCRSI